MNPSVPYVTIATAGHVDHGKSTLVRSLTGSDPDRLPEEHRRSMTIELGFSSLPRLDGGKVAIIDVPGHERLVDTMIAGAGGIDAALLVVAADDGPMPQTREHLQILDLLGVRDIVVALSRIDLIDDEWISLVAAETRSLLERSGFPGTPILPLSSRTGAGLDALRAHLLAIVPRSRPHRPDQAAWLPIDRVFSLPGFGTIVTGTLWSGRLVTGTRIAVEPSGTSAVIRQLQRHGVTVPETVAGQRVAVNLAGVERSAIRRGEVLSDQTISLASFAEAQLRVTADAPAPLTSGDLVRVLIGTDRRIARIRLLGTRRLDRGETGLAELTFDQPFALRPDDPLILRRASPPATLGGGVVLTSDAQRPRVTGRDRLTNLEALARRDPAPELRRRLANGPVLMADLLAGVTGDPDDTLNRWIEDGTILVLREPTAVGKAVSTDTMVISRHEWDRFTHRLVVELDQFHGTKPHVPGLPLTVLRSHFDVSGWRAESLIAAAVSDGFIVRSGSHVHLPGHQRRLSTASRQAANRLMDDLASQPLGRATMAAGLDTAELTTLERNEEVVRLRDDRFTTTDAFDRFGKTILDRIEAVGSVDLATVRTAHGLGREAAQRLLERLDDLGVTTRTAGGRITGPDAGAWSSARVRRSHSRIGMGILEEFREVQGDDSWTLFSRPATHVLLASCSDPPSMAVSASLSLLSAGARIRRLAVTLSGHELDAGSCADVGPADDGSQLVGRANDRDSSRAIEADLRRSGALPSTARLYVPLGERDTDRPAPMELLRAGLAMRQSGWDVWFHENGSLADGRQQRLAERIGMLAAQGHPLAPVARVDIADHLETAMDGIMADTDMVKRLCAHHGVATTRAAMSNLLAGYHRATGEVQPAARFWALRVD